MTRPSPGFRPRPGPASPPRLLPQLWCPQQSADADAAAGTGRWHRHQHRVRVPAPAPARIHRGTTR
ncbi:hypothetical protein [Streptomyces sp. AC495_CC817]|uniref:hypothetical protein n=1 Tax=Streptomyces sp. AC495_CC817 TaxID=2823900 RepID=UPI001C25F50D|nr:hypothetical protein [Streptomyces sp. AC495_CC817]